MNLAQIAVKSNFCGFVFIVNTGDVFAIPRLAKRRTRGLVSIFKMGFL